MAEIVGSSKTVLESAEIGDRAVTELPMTLTDFEAALQGLYREFLHAGDDLSRNKLRKRIDNIQSANPKAFRAYLSKRN